jgi:hypothetical protein
MTIDTNKRLYRVTEQRNNKVLATVYMVASDSEQIENFYDQECSDVKLISLRNVGTANVLMK